MNGNGKISLEYSTDGTTWHNYPVGTTLSSSGPVITLANVGDFVKFRGDNFALANNNMEYRFVMTGRIAASGSVNTLLSKDGIITNLSVDAFYSLFRNCTSLTTAPELPATALAETCYSSMFRGCTSLTTAPALPATTLANNCYYRMFDGCSSLSSVEVNFTDWSTGTSNWLNGVAASGTFTCPAALDTTTRDSTHVPADWTVVTK